MQLVFTDGSDERFAAMCGELDEYLNDIVGGEKQRTQYSKYNTLENIHDVVLIIEDGAAAACGSFKEYEPHTAEVKRVFTKTVSRNRGYGRAVMGVLEERAREKGYTRLILETGVLLKEAIRMYTALGYHIIENYGQYADMPESVCMEKKLTD